MNTSRTPGTETARPGRDAPIRKSTRRAQKGASRPSLGRPSKSSRASDYDGARALLSRYCTLIDQGDLVGLSELFHVDARFSVSFDSEPVHIGRDAILAWYTHFFTSRPAKVRYPRHKIFEPDLVVNGKRATAATYFDSDFVEPNDNVTVFAGRYDDVLIRERGRWYFSERTITICYHYSPAKCADGMKM